MLVGRERERAALASMLQNASTGASSVVVFVGDPGIGKSSLLADARQSAGRTVLCTVGLQGESGIAYVNLADLFRHHFDALDRIPDRQAAALASIFALGPSSPADRFTVSAATMSLLAAIAEDGPVLVTVDDAQWLDSASFDALLFVAHRLEAEGVLLAFGVRAGHEAANRLCRFRSIHLEGLDAASARALLAESGSDLLSEPSLIRLVEESGGNPLALLTLPTLMDADDLALWALGDDPLPIGSVLQDAFTDSIHGLPDSTRRALLMLAVIGSDAAHQLRPTLEVEGLRLADLDFAEDAGLIGYHHARPEFNHPLMRAAVYQSVTSRERRSAHRRAAELLEQAGPSMLERRGWHLVAGGTAADDTIADTFVVAAEHELAAANFTVAGKLFERSAQLTPESRTAMRRMLQAANALRLAGAIDECHTLLQDAAGMDPDPTLTAAVGHALCRLDVWRGAMLVGRDGLLEIARKADAAGASQTADVLSDAALASTVIGDLSTARATVDRALEVAAGDVPPLQVAAIAAMVNALSGKTDRARRLLTNRSAEIDAVDPLGVDFFYQLTLALSITYQSLEELDRAAELLERAIDGARDRSAVGVLPFRLGSLARIEFWRGRWSRSRALVHEALRLASDTGWVSERPSSLSTLARLEAVAGQWDDARAHAREAIAASTAAGAHTYRCLGLGALGMVELSAGRPSQAIEHFAQIADFAHREGIGNSPVLWWSSDLIECLVLDGRSDDAFHELETLDEEVARSGLPTLAAVAERCRALLRPDAFSDHMARALQLHAVADTPFETARTELHVGQFLRRRGQPRQARRLLSSALAVFDRLGAIAWADRARHELEASGVRVREPDAGLTTLSPQELQVALAVATGLSNREVAAQLFLSTKTIEFHLHNTYSKLGIARRGQLAALVAQHDRPERDR